MLVDLQGQIERITYTNEETGYTIAKVKVYGRRDLVTVVGNFMAPMPGEILKMQGEWANHPKFGEQFKVVRYKSLVPASVAGIEKYLGSGLTKGIGPVMAKRIVKKFEKETLYHRHLKISSPQLPGQDMRIRSTIILILLKNARSWQDISNIHGDLSKGTTNRILIRPIGFQIYRLKSWMIK
jgi:ATP-dependent exoDNAse (exonuclease V) alpha subunit